MDAEAIMRAMLATASRRGQLFVTGNEDHILPVEPPVSCGHQSHPRIKTYSSDDVALLSERIQEWRYVLRRGPQPAGSLIYRT